ncbi:MAG: HD domain-containing protein [Eubacteriales bacterium]|nr:HD domain-containing protein [Eubacteriales bacterium]
MERVKFVMEILDKNLMMVNDTGYVFDDGSFDETIHCYGVAYFCAAAAYRRGLDAELGFIIGLLHDLGRISNDDYTEGHGPTGAIMTQKLLADSGLFDEKEIEIIANSISRHSKKKKIDGPYEEALKDADLLERVFFMGDRGKSESKKRERISHLLDDFGLSIKNII